MKGTTKDRIMRQKKIFQHLKTVRKLIKDGKVCPDEYEINQFFTSLITVKRLLWHLYLS